MATKSVLSQSTGLKSASALQLESLMNKSKSSSSRRKSSERSSDPEDVAPAASGARPPRENADTDPSVEGVAHEKVETKASRQPEHKTGMTKSVLSQSMGMKSGSAMALGSLINKSSASKRGKSADRAGDLASVAEDDPGTEPAPEKTKAKSVKQPERKPDMTKSVLALDMNLKSGAASALGAMMNKGASSRRKRSVERSNELASVAEDATAGENADADRSEDVDLCNITAGDGKSFCLPRDDGEDDQPWLTAERPTHAESNSRSLKADMVEFCSKMNVMEFARTQLSQEKMHKPFEATHSYDNCRQRPPLACCSQSDAHELVLASRPRNVGGYKLQQFQSEPETFMQLHVTIPLNLASLHCSECSNHVGQELCEA